MNILQKINRKIKFWWQRRTRGFDDSDTWCLDITLAEFIRPRLEVFRDITYHDEEFIDEINKMIEAFKIIEEGNAMNLPKKSENYKKIKRGLKLFNKRFFNLWW